MPNTRSLTRGPSIGRGIQYFASSVVGQLAFWLLAERNDQPVATLPELARQIADYLRTRLGEPTHDAGMFPEFLVNHSGLLRPAGRRRRSLAHHLSTVDELAGTEVGYRGPSACQLAGITYRQLDYWARTGLVPPSIRVQGGQRLYSVKEILILKVIKRLLDTGSPTCCKAVEGCSASRSAVRCVSSTPPSASVRSSQFGRYPHDVTGFGKPHPVTGSTVWCTWI